MKNKTVHGNRTYDISRKRQVSTVTAYTLKLENL